MKNFNELENLNCGSCGFKSCRDFSKAAQLNPEISKFCPHLKNNLIPPIDQKASMLPAENYIDSLGREFDFFLDHFPEEPGPREIIIPHNPLITRELNIQINDILIGRPLGMSCGCPITHCGIAIDVDKNTGVIVWCVTGPLGPRKSGFKDLGYYSAEGYEGIVKSTRVKLEIGRRYFFQPRMCMLQWRHSGLINFINKLDNCWQVRLEGLWIG